MSSASSLFISRMWSFSPTPLLSRCFRSKAALEALIKASEEKHKTPQNLLLYNYPSFSGAFSALFAHLYHSHLNLPCLILPFSSVEPLRFVNQSNSPFYLLPPLSISKKRMKFSYLGLKILRFKVSTRAIFSISSDRKDSQLTSLDLPTVEYTPKNITYHINLEKSSSSAVYEYFSSKLAQVESSIGEAASLLKGEEKDRLEMVLKYIEDGDLRKWSLPDIKFFNIGLRDLRSELNCITNPNVFHQLLEVSPVELITMGKSYFSSRQDAANKLLDRPLKVRLGKGLYGDCLGVRADGYSYLSNEIGLELSVRSAIAGLRPIGAVIYMQGHNLKMCLRSSDSNTDTSEVAKAYGGGGFSHSSSFIIRMDEYNQWVSVNSSPICRVQIRMKAVG